MTRVVRIALCGALGLAMPASADVEWERIANTGDAAPGGGVFSAFGTPRILGDGSVVFRGYRQNQTHDRLFRWVPGQDLQLHHEFQPNEIPYEDPVVRLMTSFPYPERTSIATSATGSWMTITRAAEMIACGETYPGTYPSRLVATILDESGRLEVAYPPGAPVPGISGWIFSAAESVPEPLAINASGDVAFDARIRLGDLCEDDPLTPFSNAVFGPDGAGDPTLIAQTRDPAPWGPLGAVILPYHPEGYQPRPRVELNDAGEVIFEAITRTGPSGPDLHTVYRWDATTGVRRVVARGDPDLRGGVFPFGDFVPLLGRGGHVVFKDPRSYPSSALYVQDRDGIVELRHAAGDSAPGIPGATFDRLGSAPWVIWEPVGGSYAVDTAGHLAFVATIAEEGSHIGPGGVWAENASGHLELRLFEGEPLPGVPGHELTVPLQILAINDAHDVLIVATIRETGAPYVFPEKTAFVLSHASGAMEVFPREGQLAELEFGPGDVREATLSGLAFDENLTRVSALADGAVFTTSIPEPRSVWLGALSVASLGLLSTRSRRHRRRVGSAVLVIACAVPPAARALDFEVVAEVDSQRFETITSFAWMPDGALRFFVDRSFSEESSFSFYEWTDSTGSEVFDVLAPTGEIVSGLRLRDEWGPLVSFYGAFATVNRDAVPTPCGDARRGHFVLSPNGDESPVLDYGTPTPGFPVGWIWFEVRDSPVMNADGSMAFVAEVVRSDSLCTWIPADSVQRALFGPDGAGGFAVAALDEQQAPGNPPGAALVLGSVLAVNDAGHVLFEADVRLGPAGPSMPALYRWSNAAGLQRIAQTRGPTPDGASISYIWGAALEADGSVDVVAQTGEDAFRPEFHLLRIDTADDVEVIARSGDVAPGSGGRVFQSFGAHPIASGGSLWFSARVPSLLAGYPDEGGVWTRDPSGDLHRVLLSGEPVPGLDDAIVSNSGAEPLGVTEAGALLLSVAVAEASNPYPTSEDRAFYVMRSPGSLELAFARRQQIESRPEAFRPVAIAYDDASSRVAVRAYGTASSLEGTQILAVATLPEAGSIGAAFALLTLALLRLRA